MELRVEIEGDNTGSNVIGNKEAISAIRSLRAGMYLFKCISLAPKTEEEHRASFFYKIGVIANNTGNKPDVIYQDFKKKKGVESTAKLPVKQWLEIQKKFSDWALDELEILI